jgi:HSP20 family protein
MLRPSHLGVWLALPNRAWQFYVVATDNTQAGLKNGVLTISLSKKGWTPRSQGESRSALARKREEQIMAIQLWDPFREAVSLHDAMNALFQESFVRPTSFLAQDGSAALPLDVSETENELVIKASVPGVRPEDVQITVQGDTLTIRGETTAAEEKNGERWHLRERRFGAFQRSMTLGTPVDADKAQAHYENGVMTLTLPKAEEAKPRHIKIGNTAGGQSQIGQERGKK